MKKAILLMGVALGSIFQWATAQTTVINGLTVIVNYSDYSLGIPNDSISLLMNQSGFNAWNCKGSVKDFFYVQSNNIVNLNSTVIDVTLPQNFDYYHNNDATGGNFIPHIAGQIATKYPTGFQNLSTHPETGRLRHFNIISRGSKGIGVAYGVDGSFVKNNNLLLEIGGLNVYNVTGTEKPTVNTICHEVGHSVFNWTDYYRTNASNLGDFCVMASAGTETPMPINPALRYMKGWPNIVNMISATTTQTFTVTSNSYNQVFKYTNPNNPKEYLIIAAHIYGGYYQAAKGPDQGLGIYYVDEDGGTYTATGSAPIVHLIQADGLDELGTEGSPDVRGDAYDLFDNNTPVFSSATHPFRWKNGSETGITITNISPVGPTMQFTVQARQNTIHAQLIPVSGGTVSPSGLIGYVINETKTFTFTPDIGNIIQEVYVDGEAIGAQSSYTFSGTSGTHTLSVSFSKTPNIDPIPSPWSKIEIGNSRNTGSAGYRNGVFALESGSYDIWGTSDGLNYIYQPLQGDGEIVAHIKDMNKPTEWSKAGIMMRESLTTPGSKQFMIVKTPYNSIANQLRPSTDGESLNNPDDLKNLHFYNQFSWLKITRKGNVFTSYCSKDNVNWVFMGDYAIDMNASIYVGLCAGAASDAVNTKVTFDYATVTKYTAVQNLFTQFGIPRSTPLPTTIKNFQYVYAVGTGAPNLSNVSLAIINWDLVNKGLWQFSLQTNNGVPRWYTNIPAYGFNSFGQTSPRIYIDGSMGFPGFSGFFFVNTYNTNDLVLVNQSGEYAVIFSNTPPNARTASEEEEQATSPMITEAASISSAPNPFTEQTTVSIPGSFGEATVTVLNSSGIVVETQKASGSFTLGDQYAAGLYLIKVTSDYKTETIQVIKAQ